MVVWIANAIELIRDDTVLPHVVRMTSSGRCTQLLDCVVGRSSYATRHMLTTLHGFVLYPELVIQQTCYFTYLSSFLHYPDGSPCCKVPEYKHKFPLKSKQTLPIPNIMIQDELDIPYINTEIRWKSTFIFNLNTSISSTSFIESKQILPLTNIVIQNRLGVPYFNTGIRWKFTLILNQNTSIFSTSFIESKQTLPFPNVMIEDELDVPNFNTDIRWKYTLIFNLNTFIEIKFFLGF